VVSARAFSVTGLVQGVGYRPFVCRVARELGLVGWVENVGDGVVVLAAPGPTLGDEAARLALGALERALGRGPPVAEVTRVIARELELAEPPVGFHIVQALEPSMGSPVESTVESAVESPSTWPSAAPTLAPDAAPCDACLAEVLAPPSDDPRARRAGYPFTSCAACGPRLGVMLGLPWARARTTLAGFSLCGECRAEHERDDDRRFHAETLACPRCGPTLAFRVAEPPASHASSPAGSPDATVRATMLGLRSPARVGRARARARGRAPRCGPARCSPCWAWGASCWWRARATTPRCGPCGA
jgi:hydrogenase maturation protein HypF